MMPFVPFVQVPNVDRPSRWRRRSEHGFGHTADPPLARHDGDVAKMGRLMDCTIFVINGPCIAGLGAGGEGVASFSIAGPTGEGVTTPLTFCRQRRTAVVGGMRFALTIRVSQESRFDAARPRRRHGDLDGESTRRSRASGCWSCSLNRPTASPTASRSWPSTGWEPAGATG